MAESFTFDVEADRKFGSAVEQRFPQPGDESSLGLTSERPDAAAERLKAMADEAESAAKAEVAPDEVAHLKKVIGDQGNQIGELRKAAAEAEYLRKRMEMLEHAAQRAQAQPTPQGPVDIFGGIPDDQAFMSPLERQRLNQVLVALAQGVESNLSSLKEEMSYANLRTASGISEADEARLTTEHPWINELRGANRARAIAEMARANRSASDSPTRAAAEAARGAARSESFVESASPAAAANDTSLETAAEKLLRKARSGGFRSADELEAALRKLGTRKYDYDGRAY